MATQIEGEAVAGANEGSEAQAGRSDEQPGDQLFGHVVGKEVGWAPVADSALASDRHLRESVASVHRVVQDLQVQLNHMTAINQAAEQDLADLRGAYEELERERDSLKSQLGRLEHAAAASGDLREELRLLARENSDLTDQLECAGRELELHGEEQAELDALCSLIAGERDILLEETDLLEEQLTRVARWAQQLGAQVSAAGEVNTRQQREIERLERDRRELFDERDTLREEIQEAHSALAETERAIADTNRRSQLSFYEP